MSCCVWDGVSDVILFGQRDYSIRIWLDPQKLAAYGINAGDVAEAIRRENIDLPAGRVGQPPAVAGRAFDLPLDGLGRLAQPEQFAEILVKVDRGQPVQTAAAVAAAPVQVPSSLSNSGAIDPLRAKPAPGRTLKLPTALGSLLASLNQAPTDDTAINAAGSATGGGSPSASASGAGTSGGPLTGGASTGGGANTGGGGMSGGGAVTTGGATGGGGSDRQRLRARHHRRRCDRWERLQRRLRRGH